MSTDDGMYNKVLLRVCQEVCIKICYICVKNESYIEKFLIYLLYICNCYVFGSVN